MKTQEYEMITLYNLNNTLPDELRKHVNLASKYLYKKIHYEYIRRNNWTGMGPRRPKLTRIINKSQQLLNKHLKELEILLDAKYKSGDLMHVGGVKNKVYYFIFIKRL